MSMEVKRLSGAMGAEVFGIDLSQSLSKKALEQIRKLVFEHIAVFFPGQTLSPANISAIVENFGIPLTHPFLHPLDPDYPFVHELRKEPSFELNYGGAWHMDFSFFEKPSALNSLYSRECPEFGGDTMFINLYLAYDALSDGMKNIFHESRFMHGTTKDLADRIAVTPGARDDAVENLKGECSHPMFRTIPETARKCLFLDPGAVQSIEGMTVRESMPIIKQLISHMQQPEFQFRYRWRPDVFCLWDNRSCVHYALNDYPGQTRVMHRMVAMDRNRPV